MQSVTHLRLTSLLKQKRQVERDISRFEKQLQAEVDPDIDEADPDMSLRTVTAALLNNARRKIASIEQALSQVKSGGYGVCQGCGEQIDPERMEIFPQATHCVACQQKEEKRTYPRAA